MARGTAHWTVVGLSAASLAALVSLRVLTTPDPSGHGTHEQLGLAPCWTMKEFQFPCPGCGVTTSASLVAHGELAAAWSTQPFGLVLWSLAALALGWSVLATLTDRDAWRGVTRVARPWAWWTLGALVVVCWIGKIRQTHSAPPAEVSGGSGSPSSAEAPPDVRSSSSISR